VLDDATKVIWARFQTVGEQAYYHDVLKNVPLTSDWQGVTFSNVDAEALTTPWAMPHGGLRDAGYWLAGSQGVHFSGSAEFRCHDGQVEIQNRKIDWTWHDRIYAKDASGTNDPREVVLHYTLQPIFQADFWVDIHWSDTQAEPKKIGKSQ
jgi:hypothetical protein